jgi:hypothetical protein
MTVHQFVVALSHRGHLNFGLRQRLEIPVNFVGPHNVGVNLGGQFGRASFVRVREIDVIETELFTETGRNLTLSR